MHSRIGMMLGLVLFVGGLAGCAGEAAAPQISLVAEVPAPLGPSFSGRAAGSHVRALSALPHRRPATRDDQQARRYLEATFAEAGAVVETFVDGERAHLVATLPGRSSDAVLLVAAYPALDDSAWLDGSGAGLLLELARVSALQTRPYTLRFALADVRSSMPSVAAARGPETPAGAAISPSWAGSLGETRDWVQAAGDSLANTFANKSELGPLRAVIALDAPARPGLRLARDLRSHPVYRGLFWQSAAAPEEIRIFAEDGSWASPRSLHSGFRASAEGRVLALVDEQVARADLYSSPLSGEPSEETLKALGSVTARALEGLMMRLAKIDAFRP